MSSRCLEGLASWTKVLKPEISSCLLEKNESPMEWIKDKIFFQSCLHAIVSLSSEISLLVSIALYYSLHHLGNRCHSKWLPFYLWYSLAWDSVFPWKCNVWYKRCCHHFHKCYTDFVPVHLCCHIWQKLKNFLFCDDQSHPVPSEMKQQGNHSKGQICVLRICLIEIRKLPIVS